MWSQFLVFTLFISLSSFISGRSTTNDVEVKNYSGSKVLRVTPLTSEHVRLLVEWETSAEVLFWDGPSNIGKHSDILFTASQLDSGGLFHKLQQTGMKIEPFIDDVNRLIEEQKVFKGVPTPKLTWDRYYQLADINLFLEEIAASYPTIASVFSVGQSFELRNMNIVKISKSPVKKPVIFIDANIHAREWVTSAVATYLINELLTSSDPVVQQWTVDFDWYILPVFNPDGYQYSYTTDRMWRKNRSNTPSPIGCRGIDLNRNFDYHWMGGGASSNPCAETYGGNAPFSEPESANVANFINSTIKEDIKLYLSLHSYSQFIMFPYGDTADLPQYDTYMEVSRAAANALSQKFNTIFTPGNWLNILYLSTGTSMDWVQSTQNINISLTYELRDKGRYGFMLPAEQIEPSAVEFIDSLVPIINQLPKF